MQLNDDFRISLLRDEIMNYRNNKSSVSNLTRSVESILESLEESKFRSELQKVWSEMETLDAVISESGDISNDARHRDIVLFSLEVDKLLELIKVHSGGT